MRGSIRRWWPIPVLLAAVTVTQNLWFGRYDARGHAADHLTSATAIFGVTFLLAVLIFALRGPLWRRPALWVIAAGTITAAALVATGNLRVVDAAGGENWSDAQAQQLGPARSGFTSGHELADHASWIAIGLTVTLALWLWHNKALHRIVTVTAIALSLVFPRWVFPGAGLLLLTIAVVVERERSARAFARPDNRHARPTDLRSHT